MLEVSVEKTSEKEAKKRGVWAVKLARLAGGGWPDHTLFASGGRIAFVEFKRAKNYKFEPLQPFIAKMLRKLGFRYAVCKTNEEVKAFYVEWLD